MLIQYVGQPWVWGAEVFTGHPNPHARCVSRVDSTGVYIIEEGPLGVNEHLQGDDLYQFEVWRPKCSDDVKAAAITWMRNHVGEGYGYVHLAWLVITFRLLGDAPVPGLDDDPKYDNVRKICSELIAMGYYRSKGDLVPNISDRAVLPFELRNPETCDFAGLGD